MSIARKTLALRNAAIVQTLKHATGRHVHPRVHPQLGLTGCEMAHYGFLYSPEETLSFVDRGGVEVCHTLAPGHEVWRTTFDGVLLVCRIRPR